MTDSVWWYVLAGFALGFILSTLWEWLFFRRRRLRIENRRIAELEAALRAQPAANRSTNSSAPAGLAEGYQSPNVFLEGEQGAVDTVQVIVPEPLPPVSPHVTAQPSGGQFTPYQQFVTTWPDPNVQEVHAPHANGNGKKRDKQKAVTSAAGGSAAASAETPAANNAATNAATTAATTAAVAAAAATAAALASRDKNQPAAEHEPSADAPTAVGPAPLGAVQSPAQSPLRQPPAQSAETAGMAQADASSRPVQAAELDSAPPASPPVAAATAATVTAPPAPGSETPPAAASPAAPVVSSAASPQPVAPSEPPAEGTSAPPGSPLEDATPVLPPDVATIIAAAFGPGLEPKRDDAQSRERSENAFGSQPDSRRSSQPGAEEVVPSPSPDKPLPPSAILPAAPKPPALSKDGTAPARSTRPATAAVAARGIEPEITQVSNQLGGLIASINGLIDKTQPLLDEPPRAAAAPGAQPSVSPAPAPNPASNVPALAPAGSPTDPAANRPAFASETGEEGLSGPYSARNLSRMEYAVVQLMQSLRRLGRAVRSAIE